MKAMILAAGKGTRLGQITQSIPKALVKIGGKPMLERVINQLVSCGVTEIIINTYHLADQIKGFIKNKDFGIPVHTLYEPQLLETAGGVANAREYLGYDQPVIIHNTDILSTIDLQKLYQAHDDSKYLATVAIRKPANDRPFLVCERGLVVGHRNKNTKEEIFLTKPEGKVEEYTFCGVHIMSQHFLDYLASQETKGVSIVAKYLDIIAQGKKINTYNVDDAYWIDVGNPTDLTRAEDWYQSQNK